MKDRIESLIEKRKQIELGGGEEKIEKQRVAGKLTARERINLLLDQDSFIEVDAFIKHRSEDFGLGKTKIEGDGVVTGYGTVEGRLVFVYSQDFTVLGGSLGEMHANKIVKVQEMALKMGAPIVGFNDSGGARIQEGVDSLSGYGKIFYNNTKASGVIPQITSIVGPSAGGAVYSPAITDFIFMVEGISKMFITGPQVVKTVTGEDIDQEDLGGAKTHSTKSGVADFINLDEINNIKKIRELLGFLPSNNLDSLPIYDSKDSINRIEEELNNIVPEDASKPYDMKFIIKTIADDNYFFEVKPLFAKNIIVGFIRLNGKTIGVVANQPNVLAGCLDINASDKAARFIRTCDAFNIPLLNLVDVPGFLPGTDQEYGGIIRHGAKMLYAYSESTVPKVTMIIRKAYGGAYIAMCNKELGADQVFAWPNAEIAVMGPDGAANIIFKNDIKNSDNPVETRKEKIEEYKNTVANPYTAAARGYVDDVIVPSLSRPRLISAFDMLETKRESNPPKKHGNIPL